MEKLSQKQLQILEYMKKEVREKGYPPSVREICDAVGLKSTSTVHGHLERLEKKGYIKRDPSKPRAIEIFTNNLTPEVKTSISKEIINIPIVGTVTAGTPILADENIEDTFPMQMDFAPRGDVFILRVKGDSMINAGIYNKDLIFVKQQNSAENGDIVVALIEDFSTVKTFYRENGYIRLQPENPTMSPILVRDVTIVGKVVGLYRRF